MASIPAGHEFRSQFSLAIIQYGIYILHPCYSLHLILFILILNRVGKKGTTKRRATVFWKGAKITQIEFLGYLSILCSILSFGSPSCIHNYFQYHVGRWASQCGIVKPFEAEIRCFSTRNIHIETKTCLVARFLLAGPINIGKCPQPSLGPVCLSEGSSLSSIQRTYTLIWHIMMTID